MNGNDHFLNCHPEDARAPETVEGYRPTDTEACWHCGTLAKRGCYCPKCMDTADDVPPEMVYHCPVCGRWWAYMYLRVIEMILGREPE